MITKETARQMLQDYIDRQVNQYGKFTLPIKDVVISETMGFDVQQTMNSYTWRYLIMVAYS